MIPLEFWEGLGVGLSLSAVGLAALWWYLQRRWVRAPSPVYLPSAGSTPHSDAALPAPIAHPPENSLSAPSKVFAADELTPASLPDREAATVRRANPSPKWDVDLRVSQRVLLHVARQGIVGPNEVAPLTLCQSGMVETLAISQGVLTGVLRRLLAAGVISERREHVRGMDRRVKVYRLTSTGEQLVRDLRRRPRP